MQRFIAVRVLQSLLALVVMSMIVFGLARLSGNPIDVMLPIAAGVRFSPIMKPNAARIRIATMKFITGPAATMIARCHSFFA